MRLIKTLLAAAVAGLVSASPTNTTALNLPKRDGGGVRNNLDWVRGQFPGIYWDEAVDNCSDEELHTLFQASKNAIKISASDESRFDTPGWNRYFTQSSKWESGIWLSRYKTIFQNMYRASNYPVEGTWDGNFKRENQVVYTCKPLTDQTQTACDGYAEASTANAGQLDVKESQIIFCPRFFKNKVHIDEYVEKHPNEDSTYLNKKFNGIYETVILHEWMHANVFGFSRGGSGTNLVGAVIVDITDKATTAEGAKEEIIYGDDLCHRWAWKYKGSDTAEKDRKPNALTVANADTYALFFMYNYFHRTYNWDGDGKGWTKRGEDDKPLSYSDINVVSASDVDTKNVEAPENCQAKNADSPMDLECEWKQASDNGDDGDDSDNDGLTDAEVECDENDSSGLPAKIFTDGMYDKFCREDHGDGHVMAVNVHGATAPSRNPLKRSPPVSKNSYKNARGVLEFKKKKNNNDKCKGTCADAFKRLAQSQCGRTGGEQSSMARSGKIDVGCGTYGFQAESGNDADKGDNRPATHDLVPICNKPSKISGAPTWSEYNEGSIKANNAFCDMDVLNDNMDENSQPITRNKLADFPFDASITWIEGCKSSSVDPKNPVDDWTCRMVFTEARYCGAEQHNIGGGYIDAGCLRYNMGVPAS